MYFSDTRKSQFPRGKKKLQQRKKRFCFFFLEGKHVCRAVQWAGRNDFIRAGSFAAAPNHFDKEYHV